MNRKNSYSEISELYREKSRIELLEMLSKAEDDVANKRVEPIEHTFHNLRKRLREK